MVRHLAKRVYFAYLFLLVVCSAVGEVVGGPRVPFYKTYLDLQRYSSFLQRFSIWLTKTFHDVHQGGKKENLKSAVVDFYVVITVNEENPLPMCNINWQNVGLKVCTGGQFACGKSATCVLAQILVYTLFHCSLCHKKQAHIVMRNAGTSSSLERTQNAGVGMGPVDTYRGD